MALDDILLKLAEKSALRGNQDLAFNLIAVANCDDCGEQCNCSKCNKKDKSASNESKTTLAEMVDKYSGNQSNIKKKNWDDWKNEDFGKNKSKEIEKEKAKKQRREEKYEPKTALSILIKKYAQYDMPDNEQFISNDSQIPQDMGDAMGEGFDSASQDNDQNPYPAVQGQNQ